MMISYVGNRRIQQSLTMTIIVSTNHRHRRRRDQSRINLQNHDESQSPGPMYHRRRRHNLHHRLRHRLRHRHVVSRKHRLVPQNQDRCRCHLHSSHYDLPEPGHKNPNLALILHTRHHRRRLRNHRCRLHRSLHQSRRMSQNQHQSLVLILLTKNHHRRDLNRQLNLHRSRLVSRNQHECLASIVVIRHLVLRTTENQKSKSSHRGHHLYEVIP
mmetsp:Transcript_47384/g.115613  ORF Transcript_47384/g.115613 Transcript_47384/m.115613 type:complete len:214 (+) Transcript_47384:693-1334(+)